MAPIDSPSSGRVDAPLTYDGWDLSSAVPGAASLRACDEAIGRSLTVLAMIPLLWQLD